MKLKGAMATPPRIETRAFRINSIAAGGAGVGRDGGRAVFVPRTAPGDLVEAAVEITASTLRGRLLRVIEPGSTRVTPVCPFVETCGGCDLMHLSPEAQRAAHRDIVLDALRRVAGLGTIPEIVAHEVPADPALPPGSIAYRTRARLHARSVRGRVEVGYHAASSHEVVAVDHCAVLAPDLDALLRELPALLAGASGTGEISVARGAGGLPIVSMRWAGDLPQTLWSSVDERVTAGRWAGAHILLAGAATPAKFGDPRPILEGADGRPIIVAAGGFAQPSAAAGTVLARRTADLARKTDPGTLVELYAGCGTLSILLAPLTTKFVAVESHEDSAIVARENLAARGFKVKVANMDASSYDLHMADTVVLDPPRTGARHAIFRIAASRASTVVYVACDPVTMSRDIGALAAAGFTLTDVETVEMFPQTSHIETLVRLIRTESQPGKKN